MYEDLKNTYIPLLCAECQQNKTHTSKPMSPLHPLPVPNDCFNTITLDFIGQLPEEDGRDAILTPWCWYTPHRHPLQIHCCPCSSTNGIMRMAWCLTSSLTRMPSISSLVSNWRCQPLTTLRLSVVANKQTKPSTKPFTTMSKTKMDGQPTYPM